MDPIFIIPALFVLWLYSKHRTNTEWNNGICRENGLPWETSPGMDGEGPVMRDSSGCTMYKAGD
jgi:hypothetical protein